MSRYGKRGRITNDGEYYRTLIARRRRRRITHYDTPILHNPTVRQRAQITTNKHLWKYGDRLYTLAHNYYGDAGFWWIIAWWNGYGTEADIKTGAILYIPLDISATLKALGV
jgi:hypothetical protein